MRRGFFLGLLLLLAAAAPVLAGPIDTLKPGEWYEVPNSHLRSVGPNPPAPNSAYPNVINPWSGGTYDTKRDRLIVWGGGHSDYSGNEIYAFSIGSLTWQRLTDPSTDVGGSEASGYYPDGKPRSRHTYEYIEYLGPTFDRFCSFGGHGLYPSGQIGTSNTDCFNFATNQWERYASTPVFGIGSCSAYDPVKGHGWMHGGGTSSLAEFNPTANTWTVRGAVQNDIYYANAEIDPVRRRFIAIGHGIHASWNIDASGTIARTNLATSGATSIESVDNPGLAYDSASDRMVAWSGGGDVYVLNLSTLVWSRVSPAGTNQVTPTAPDNNGTYGRFRYIASKNAFIVVNAIDQDVYIYKLTAGGGSPSDSLPPANTSDLRTR